MKASCTRTRQGMLLLIGQPLWRYMFAMKMLIFQRMRSSPYLLRRVERGSSLRNTAMKTINQIGQADLENALETIACDV